MFSRDSHGLSDSTALGHHVLDDNYLFAGLDLEAAAQHEIALLLLDENEAHSKLPRHLLPDHESAHGRGQHGDRLVAVEFSRQRRTQALDAWHVLQRHRALEKLSAAQAAAQNEMTLQQRAGVLEELKNLVPRHAAIEPAKRPKGKPI